MTSEPITSEPSHVHALFDPASRYNRLRLAAGLDDKMRGYFHWLRSRQDRKETVERQNSMVATPQRALIVSLDSPGTATPAEVEFRFSPATEGERTVDIRFWLKEPKDFPWCEVRCRAWLMDPAFWQRLRATEPSVPEEPSAEGMRRLINDDTLRGNLEVARILSAIPELEGSVDEIGCGYFSACSLPDSCNDFQVLPDDVFVVIVLNEVAKPAPAEKFIDTLGYVEKLVLLNDPIRPRSLVRQLQELGEQWFYPQAAGGGDSEQIAASVIYGKEELSWPSSQFKDASTPAILHGLGMATALVKSGAVRFESGSVRVDPAHFPADDTWAFFCLASSTDLEKANRKEMFALRKEVPQAEPFDTSDPYALLESGHVLAARKQARQFGWSGLRYAGLQLVSAGRMATLVDAAVAQAKERHLLAGYENVLEKFVKQSTDLINGIILAIIKRLQS